MKLPLIWIYLCLKLVFENANAGRNTGCSSVVNCARYQPTPTFPAFQTSVESMTPPAVQTRFTRRRVRELQNGHNSVTVQNRKHVYMIFFHHKGLGNHLLQLCPKVVKHLYVTRLASNGIFSSSNKIHREVGRAKDLSAPRYIYIYIYITGVLIIP